MRRIMNGKLLAILSATTAALVVGLIAHAQNLDVKGTSTIESNGYFYGSVGIGTTSPAEALEVNGSARIDGFDQVLHAYDTSTSSLKDLIGAYNGWDPHAIYIGGYNAANSTGRDDNKVLFGSQAYMDVDLTTGNVGIGTTTPANALDVGGSSSGAVRIDGRGALFLAAESACMASGGAARFTVWSAGTAQTCTQACNAVVCGGTVSTCVKGWSAWSGATDYQYSSECTAADPSNGMGISGKLCCCANTYCQMPIYK